jgi:hypothetical protein
MSRLILVAPLLTAAACAGVDRPQEGPLPPEAGPDDRQRYEVTATVLEREDQGPTLCLSGIALSLPPRCGDVPITNWDWGEVPGERNLRGTTWGDYHLTGTYDGESFTLEDAGPAEEPPPFNDGGDPIDTPCDEPEGGWVADEPSRTSEADRQAASQTASAEPDFAGLWIDYVGDPKPEDLDADPTSAQVILNVAFTADLERHTADLRALWGGPLCVVRHQRTEQELQRIQADFPGGDSDFGLNVLWSSIEVVENVVEVGVVAIDAEGRAALDDRYGDGAVRPVPALRPIG